MSVSRHISAVMMSPFPRVVALRRFLVAGHCADAKEETANGVLNGVEIGRKGCPLVFFGVVNGIVKLGRVMSKSK